MKGDALILVPATAALFTLFMSIVFLNVQAGISREDKLTRDVYLLEHTLTYGKLVAEQSFIYSFYQSCYDTLRSQGVWYENDDKVPQEDAFKATLAQQTAVKLNTYTSRQYHYLFDLVPWLPSDYRVSFTSEKNFGLLGIAYSPTSAIFIEKKSDQEEDFLSIPSNLQKTFDTSCLELFVKERLDGKTLGKGIEQAVYGVTNTYPKHDAVTVEGTVGGTNRDLADLYFQQHMGKSITDVETELLSRVRTAVESVKLASEFSVAQTVKTLSATIEPTCSAQIQQQTDGVTRTLIDCTFTYHVTAEEDVSITDTREERKWPVFNGQDVAMESPTLRFRVKIDKSIDRDILLFDATGTYTYTFTFTEGFQPVTKQIAFLQDGNELDWSVPLGSGTLTGTGQITGEDIILTQIPLEVTDMTGLLHLAAVDITGTVESGTVTGTLADTTLPIDGTYTTQPRA